MADGLQTTVVGSYPQPRWLVDEERLRAKYVPRVRASDIWRIPREQLAEAQDDATILAIRDQERAGIDVISDGEIRRESYSNHFATALSGIDLDNPFLRRVGEFEIPLPRVVGPIRRERSVLCDDLHFLLANTDRPAKITLPGPFTMSKQAADDYYGDPEALAMAYAEVVNAEARELAAAGAQVIQLDEPWLREAPDDANAFALRAIDRALEDVAAVTCIHLCFGYGFIVSNDKPKAYQFLAQLGDSAVDQISLEAAQPHLDLGVLSELAPKTIVLGVIDLASNDVESAEVVAARIRRALPFASVDRLIAAPDCGMKYLSRKAAFGKLCALAEGARIVRVEMT